MKSRHYITKVRLAAIIKKFGKPVEAGDGYILSVPLVDCIHVGNLEVIPADGADGRPSISYIAYEKPRPRL
jgi:hypothetical protein